MNTTAIACPRAWRRRVSGRAAAGAIMLASLLAATLAVAQTPPSTAQIARFDALHRAAHEGRVSQVESLLDEGAALEARDDNGRTALHVAAFASHEAVIRALAAAGADMNARDRDAYDIVTIAAVANDLPLLDLALASGASARNTTSPYEGTALIAAAHLGHHEVVQRLIDAGAPLDHINNLGWTALIEAVVLGDGGPAHVACVRALLRAGADPAIQDRQGRTALELATERGFTQMVQVMQQR